MAQTAIRLCEISGCDAKHFSRGWCQKHYRRWSTTGTVELDQPTAADRFWEKVDIQVSPCWEWQASLNNKGYGQFWDGERLVLAHRWSYEHHRGEIPEGLVIDHLCRNSKCVNPTHLEPVTQEENMARARRDACRRGHPWPEHEYRYPDGRRECRTCSNDSRRARRRAQKES